MNALRNFGRVMFGIACTGFVGTPLLLVIYTTYLFGRVCALLGNRQVLDRVLAWNTRFTGGMAQRYWATPILKTCGIHLRTREEVAIDWSRTHVICANHASIFDILALTAVLEPPFRFVAKRELLRWPIIGWALRPAGQIVINRADRGDAVRRLEEEATRGIDGQVIFFVEGTRSRTGELMPFKKGAFHFAIDHQLPILPTAIHGSFGVLARVSWWHIHPGRDIEIRFGKPIPPPPEAGPDKRELQQLMDETRAEINAALARERIS